VRAVVVLSLLAGCSFRAHSSSPPIDATGGTVDTPRGSNDAAIDAPVMLIDAPPDAPTTHTCPAGYNAVQGAPATSKYKLFSFGTGGADQTAGFTAANQACATDGTHLIIAETAAEAAAIGAQLQYAQSWPYFWDGVTDAAQEGSWKTVLGGDATYLPWASGQPSGGTAQNCAVFDQAGVLLYDYDCITASPFACECE
jgi:hypothetical protein